MCACGDNSRNRKAIRKTTYSKKPVVFPVFNNDHPSWCRRAACYCWGAEVAVQTHSHFPATWWKMYPVQSSIKLVTLAPLPVMWQSMSVWAVES